MKSPMWCAHVKGKKPRTTPNKNPESKLPKTPTNHQFVVIFAYAFFFSPLIANSRPVQLKHSASMRVFLHGCFWYCKSITFLYFLPAQVSTLFLLLGCPTMTLTLLNNSAGLSIAVALPSLCSVAVVFVLFCQMMYHCPEVILWHGLEVVGLRW